MIENNRYRYKVVIPTAGLGSRLLNESEHVNKALIPIAHKPIISHIIEKFPEDVELVIPLGYKKETLKQYLLLAYPDRKITFVEIDNFDGEGAGLGYTLLCCKEHLQCPFIFISNDTLVIEGIPAPSYNWMGWDSVSNSSPYRTILISGANKVSKICEKGEADASLNAYIGLAGIKDFSDFWKIMDQEKDNKVVQIGESHGLRYILKKGIKAHHFTWFDTGNPEALARTQLSFKKDGGPNILKKEKEDIWFVGDSVIKFSLDKKFISDRVVRGKIISEYIPEITGFSENMYRMKYIDGDILSKSITISIFQKLLKNSLAFWSTPKLSDSQIANFKETCSKFYKNKTLERIHLFYKNFGQTDQEETINGVKVPFMHELLASLDWDWLSDGVPVNFHGDFHFENIIYQRYENKFYFLDWRQNFGGILEYGDIYYDLAKLNHGLIMCHELVDKNLFKVNCGTPDVTFDFNRKQSLVECEQFFYDFLQKHNFDLRKVKILTYLIFLNIAALHHDPYCKLLYYLGKTGLYNILENKNED